MNAHQLAEKGEALKNILEVGDYELEHIKLSDYGQWTALCSMYLEKNYPTNNATKRFIDLVKKPETRSKDSFEELLGIIKGLWEWEESDPKLNLEVDAGPSLRELLDSRKQESE
ncbi:MAG TPA: hypothetical protein DCZ10_16290 [Pelotomaculum sp.]|jgi:hypothetical protein|nr:hypothetical protein [Pelotomaculum sp.]